MNEYQNQLVSRLQSLHENDRPAVWPNLLKDAAETIRNQALAIDEERAKSDALARRNALLVIEIEELRAKLWPIGEIL